MRHSADVAKLHESPSAAELLAAELTTQMLPAKNDSGGDWRALLMLRCQLLAGRSLDASPRMLIRDLRQAVRDLPAEISARDRLLIRGLLGSAFARVVRSSDLNERTEMTRTLLDWLTSSAASDRWHEELGRVLDAWSAISGDRDDPLVRTPNDHRVERALRFLDDRYKDANVRLSELAAETDLSAWHAARLLKRHTGYGFLAHVHRRRVAAARCLLAQTTLSVKEIAGAVGYEDSSQFCRHFKRLGGITPLGFRQAGSKTTSLAAKCDDE